ncbi:MAG: hypothetical protein WC797_02155 [Candidatus Paceibacterota bacterium]|jgi:intein-encoded DNA endonuclease-like protein
MPVLRLFNKNFFKKWSSDMAYILGFMYADGNVVFSKRGTHFVAIYTNDYLLLEAIRSKLASNHKISKRVSLTGNCFRLQIGSTELFNDLSNLGLVIRKTTRMKLPEVPSEYFGDFVRGYFDGDGNVWSGIAHKTRKTKCPIIYSVFTSCSFEFLFELKNRLKMIGTKGGSLYRVKDKNCSRLLFATWDTLKLYEIMYNGKTSLELPRKRVIFEKFLKMRS